MSRLEMRYFILKPKGTSRHAEASRKALVAYAIEIMRDDPEFANELFEWEQAERYKANHEAFGGGSKDV